MTVAANVKDSTMNVFFKTKTETLCQGKVVFVATLFVDIIFVLFSWLKNECFVNVFLVSVITL